MGITYKVSSLAEVLAQIAQFNVSDYEPNSVPPDVAWNVSYICACFLAQHTQRGHDGVETEHARVLLKIGESMSYRDRVTLAEIAIKEYGGTK